MNRKEVEAWIRGFDAEIAKTCPPGARMCRGGSQSLYRLMRDSRTKPEGFEMSKLAIWSGLGHTFLRYDDPELYIDPTFRQVNPEMSGTFIGTREELAKAIPASSPIDIHDFAPDAKPPPTFPVPPLTKETALMKGGRRKTRRRLRKRISR